MMPFLAKRERSLARRAQLTLEPLESRHVPAITFHGGAVLPQVEVEPVYYGSYWGSAPGSQQGSDLNTFLQYITSSSFMDMLGEYGVGRGTLVDNGIADPGISAGQTINDSQIRSMISTNIAHGFLQGPDRNRLYLVFTAPDVTVTSGSESSFIDFFGYHDSFIDSSLHVIRYAVVAHPQGNGDAPGLNDFQTLTWVASHEIAESTTDPDSGGWFDTKTGDEIADVCDSVNDAGTLAGYVVSAVWSVRQASCVLPAGSQPFVPSQNGVPSFALRNEVAAAFLTSDEYSTDLIVKDYQQLLGRTPGSAEIASWLGAMRAGLSDEQMLADFAGSPEYYQRAGSNDRAWIDSLYHDLLGRTPASAEENLWLRAIAGGTSRADVALDFANSPEHETRVVAADYQSYLGRTAGSAEAVNWVVAFENGVLNNEQIIADLVASDEFYFGQGGTVESWLTGLYRTVLGRPPDKDGFAAWDAFVTSAMG